MSLGNIFRATKLKNNHSILFFPSQEYKYKFQGEELIYSIIIQQYDGKNKKYFAM